MTKLLTAIILLMLAIIIIVNLEKAEQTYCKAILSNLVAGEKLTIEQSQCLTDINKE